MDEISWANISMLTATIPQSATGDNEDSEFIDTNNPDDEIAELKKMGML